MKDIIRNKPCVYFISDGQGHCKIGIASDIYNRMNVLQVGSAFDLEIKNIIYTEDMKEAEDIERYYHGKLHKKRIRGEWFEECAVDNAISGVFDENKYELPEGFNMNDLISLFMLSHFAKDEEHFLRGYDEIIPDWIKDEDKKKGITPVQHYYNSRARRNRTGEKRY